MKRHTAIVQYLWALTVLLVGVQVTDARTVRLGDPVFGRLAAGQKIDYTLTVPPEFSQTGIQFSLASLGLNTTDPIYLTITGNAQPREYYVPFAYEDCSFKVLSDTLLPVTNGVGPNNISLRQYIFTLSTTVATGYNLTVLAKPIRVELGAISQITITNKMPTYLYFDYYRDAEVFFANDIIRIELNATQNAPGVSTMKAQVDNDDFLIWSLDGVHLSDSTFISTFRNFGATVIDAKLLSDGFHRIFVKMEAPPAICDMPDTLYNVQVRIVYLDQTSLKSMAMAFLVYLVGCVILIMYVPRDYDDEARFKELSSFELENQITPADEEDQRSPASPAEVSIASVRLRRDTSAGHPSEASPAQRAHGASQPSFFKALREHMMLYLSIVVFYSLPAYQLVWSYQQYYDLGQQDACFYNFQCMFTVTPIPAFNNVFSNFGYCLAGIAVMFITRRKYTREAANFHRSLGQKGLNTFAHYILLFSLGMSIVCEGLMSGLYHLCPTKTNYQFDTTFMFVCAAMLFLSLYIKRTHDQLQALPECYFVLAGMVALNVVGIMVASPWYWLFLMFILAILSWHSLVQPVMRFIRMWRHRRPLATEDRPKRRTDIALLITLFTMNIYAWALIFFARYIDMSIPNYLLGISVGVALIYMAFYLTVKLLNNEPLAKKSKLFLALSGIVTVCALLCFAKSPTDKAALPSDSRDMNAPCVDLYYKFFDIHDVWHVLSSMFLMFGAIAVLYIDDGLHKFNAVHIVLFDLKNIFVDYASEDDD